ncbi:alpha/beta hydrolase family esterase [Microbacterium sp. NPDC091313]
MDAQLTVDGRERTYTVIGEEASARARALVLVLHGSRQDGRAHHRFAGGQYDALAGPEVVVAYLDGVGGFWNDARRQSTSIARRRDVDDVGFVDAVIERLAASHGIDRRRVYAVGFSNGGQMVMRLLHERPALLAGAAVVAATLPDPDSFLLPQTGVTPHPVPIMLVHGDADPISPYAGGPFRWWARRAFGVGGAMRSVADTAAYFARRNGISAAPATSQWRGADGMAIRRTEFPDAAAPVVAYTVAGGGHTVPGPAAAPRIVGRTATGMTVADAMRELFAL